MLRPLPRKAWIAELWEPETSEKRALNGAWGRWCTGPAGRWEG
uniref:Macaca fascicularis brain cDNA clone: QflA-22589, similar to human thrombomodulin (THBD), mRNA, RefSeq: NM_000361.2 n=1 Tax=Macaca fascicularis TaxID=9541 RepID=I7G7E5_MACFA|nr:unnamed protein product [Macaca fascicularis]